GRREENRNELYRRLMAIDRDALTGLILAGGLSSRMQRLAVDPAAGTSPPSFQHDSGGKLNAGLATATAGTLRHAEGASPHGGNAVVDKGLLQLNNQPLIRHASQFLAPRVRQVLISANR